MKQAKYCRIVYNYDMKMGNYSLEESFNEVSIYQK